MLKGSIENCKFIRDSICRRIIVEINSILFASDEAKKFSQIFRGLSFSRTIITSRTSIVSGRRDSQENDRK